MIFICWVLRGRGKASVFGGFLHFRCLFCFLPALKASDFAWFPFFRCLFALSRRGKASVFGGFLHFRCLFCFLPALKASDFARFPFLRCLFALSRRGKASDSGGFLCLRCLPPLPHQKRGAFGAPSNQTQFQPQLSSLPYLPYNFVIRRIFSQSSLSKASFFMRHCQL